MGGRADGRRGDASRPGPGVRRMAEAEHFLRAGQWNRWRYDMFAGADIHGSTLGILGMGRIGQGIARRGAYGFGMKVIYHNRSRLDAALEAECKASYVSKDELLRTADHVVLVLPYSPASPSWPCSAWCTSPAWRGHR